MNCYLVFDTETPYVPKNNIFIIVLFNIFVVMAILIILQNNQSQENFDLTALDKEAIQNAGSINILEENIF